MALALALASSATIASDAAVMVSSSLNGADTDITFTITEGVYTTGSGSKGDSRILWGSEGGGTYGSSNVLNDTITYSGPSTANFNYSSITHSGLTVNSVFLAVLSGGGQKIENGAITFTFAGDLTNLDFGTLALGSGSGESFVGVDGSLSTVPEPSVMILSMLGSLGLILRRKR